jgi:hypothetical protein
MANTAIPSVRCRKAVSTMVAFLTLAGRNARRSLAPVTLTLVTVTCLALTGLAQDQPEPSAAPDAQSNQQTAQPRQPAQSAQPATVTIPAGTPFALVLTNPLSSKSVHRGDQIHAQTTNPIAIADQVVIPAGTFVQGTVDKLSRNGSRGEVMLQSAKFIFSDGYVANIAGPINVESDEGTAWLNPGNGTKAAMFGAPLAGLGLGALIGSAAHTTQSSTLGGTTITSSTPKGLAIGSMVGLAVGGAVALTVFLHSHQFFVDVGSPMEMTLQQPVTLSQNRVADAVREAQENPVPPPVASPRPVPYYPVNHGTCFTPGTPGTPPTMIPGAPGPNGVPGPPTMIPGTPPTPGTPYPCP